MPKTINAVEKAYNPTVASYMVHEREITTLYKDWKHRNNSAQHLASTKQIIIKFYNIASHSYYTNM